MFMVKWIFFNSLESNDVNRTYALCDLEKTLFLALNSGYVVQQRERIARFFSGWISNCFFDILEVLVGVSKCIVGELHTLAPPGHGPDSLCNSVIFYFAYIYTGRSAGGGTPL
jgi:hypothetical protein